MSLELTLHLTLESDYHVGAGHGRGALVDSALLRDADGLPVLRGSMITGLLRDALRRLLQLEPLRAHRRCQASGLPTHDAQGRPIPTYCGERGAPGEPCPLCRLLGSPAQPKGWRISGARLQEAPRPAAAAEQLGRAVGLRAVRAGLNRRLRRAEARRLFAREEGRRGLTFTLTASCPLEGEAALDEAAWLMAAARAVRRLGAGRRRGRGACRLHLAQASADGVSLTAQTSAKDLEAAWLDRWGRLAAAGPASSAQQAVAAPAAQPAQTSAPRWSGALTPPAGAHTLRVRVVARLDEPLLIAERSQTGNELRSLDYLPGGALRGALAARAAERQPLHDHDSAAYAQFVRLFMRGGLCCGPLYPARLDLNALYPSIPAPRDLFGCALYPGFKHRSENPLRSGVEGFARYARATPLSHECPVCAAHGRPEVDREAVGGLISLNRYAPLALEPARLYELHPRINPATGRAASGALFAYETLAPGQYLLGEITLRDEAAWQELIALAGLPLGAEGGEITLSLGKAHRGSQGQARLWFKRQEEDQPSLYCPQKLETRVAAADQVFVLTLLSDTIVRDPWGRAVTTFEPGWLSDALGLAVETERVFAGARVIDGFNAHLGLPRWRDVALVAGSAVGLRVTQALTLEALRAALARVEQEGLGLRRGEGFGLAAFNHPVYDACAHLPSTAVNLPATMRPGSLAVDQLDLLARRFAYEWSEYLAGPNLHWARFRPPEFGLLARLIHEEAPADDDALGALLARVEHVAGVAPDPLIPTLQEREALKPRFQHTRGQEGWALLADLRAQLQQQAAGRPAHWRLGLAMLVERIAAEAAEEKR